MIIEKMKGLKQAEIDSAKFSGQFSLIYDEKNSSKHFISANTTEEKNFVIFNNFLLYLLLYKYHSLNSFLVCVSMPKLTTQN
jgi:hypothetical protein